MHFKAAAAVAALVAAVPAHAEAGDVLVRMRGILVTPTEQSGEVSGFPGSEVGVTDSFMPEIDFTVMATDHIGAELIVATTRHEATGGGSLSAIDEVASTWVLPPTLTLQYHLAPGGKVRPYVGAGVNYTWFYSEKASDALEDALGPTTVTMDDSFGYALQAGVDIDLTDRVFLNLDIKYVDMDTMTHLRTAAGTATVDVSIDPVIVGAGLGMRF